MEKVISLLYDIEEKANQIVTRANEEKVKLKSKFDHDLELLDQEIADKTNQKLNVLKDQISKELTKEKQSLIDNCNKQISHIETNYNQNHNSLVTNIIQVIING